MALTIKEIENAKPRAKKYKLADGGGLCLRQTVRRKALALAVSVRWYREEYVIWGLPSPIAS